MTEEAEEVGWQRSRAFAEEPALAILVQVDLSLAVDANSRKGAS
jgi:hypothetical protein